MEQHYAVSKDGVLTHIKVAHANSEEYYCPHCNCRMLKRCGKIRAWHFAHDWHFANDFQKKCSYESYLHSYAKLRLKQWFDESPSIILHYTKSIACKQYELCPFKRDKVCVKTKKEKCDIKKYFNHCSIESSVKESNGNYRADLLLTSDYDKSRRILIEIKVSHGCSDKKITSNAQIIEFEISSEEDLEYIINHDIIESEKVRYYGFKNRIKPDNDGLIKPQLHLNKFILFESGKTFCKKTVCQDFTTRGKSALFELTTNFPNKSLLTLHGLMLSHELGFKIPNCHLCKHYFYNNQCNHRECNLKKCSINTGADALQCNAYELNQFTLEEIKNMYIGSCNTDIWVKDITPKLNQISSVINYDSLETGQLATYTALS